MSKFSSRTTRGPSSLILGFTLVALGSILLPSKTADATSGQSCAGRSASALDRLFSGQVGRVVGSDYVRPFLLPNGSTLVLMQDVFLAAAPSGRPVTNLRQATFVHNAGVLIDADGCVRRTLTGARSYLGSSETNPLSRWFWAMGGAIGRDGYLHVMVAELRNPNGTGAASGAAPVATWQATIDPVTLVVRSFRHAVDDGAGLYGWAVASDRAFTYLYSYCYRQFIPGEYLGHDPSCSDEVRVARVPLGEFDSPLEYYGHGGWQTASAAAEPLEFPGNRAINPVSIQHFGNTFVSVSKEGDWWGTTIYVDIAAAPTGPWKTITTITPTSRCVGCNTYYASLMPWRQSNGSLVVALSNNAWDMRGVAFGNPSIYRNSFFEIAVRRELRPL